MHTGTLIIDIQAMYEQIRSKYLCEACGEFTKNCKCAPVYGDEWKAELEDDPGRGV